MPWSERLPMDQRLQLVQDYRSGLFTMTELAEQYRDQPEDWLQVDRSDGRCGRRRRAGGPLSASTPQSGRYRAAHRCDPRGPAKTPPSMGAQKTVGVGREAAPDRRRLAEPIDGIRATDPGRIGDRPRPSLGVGRPCAVRLGADHRAQRDVDDGFQRRISHGRPALLLSADAARRLQPIRVALRWVAQPDPGRHAAAICPGFCGVRLARSDPERQRRAVCRHRARAVVPSGRVVDAAGHCARTHRARAARSERIA